MPWAIEILHCSFILLAIIVSFTFSLNPFVQVLNDDLSIIHFDASGCDGYKSFELHKNVLYVGGRDSLYKQNPANISKSLGRAIPWKVPHQQYRKCLTLPQGESEMCHNYIRLIQPYNASHILLCGSMALDATNIFLHIESGTLHRSSYLGAPLCSYKPEESVTSVMGVEGGSFSSIAASSRPHIPSSMGILMNLPQSDSLLTSEGPGKMINGKATFAFSFSAIDSYHHDRPMNKMYFVFSESVDKQYNPHNFGTRIAQVCANDRGDWSNGWTSFLKVPLLCQTNEEEPFVFNYVTHSAVSDDGILYGTFNTQSSFFRSGAICAYRIRDIQHAFHFRKFITMSENGEYRERSSQIPSDPSPGDCAYPGMKGKPNATSKDFAPDFVNFMTVHHLVATTVTPIQPLDFSSMGPLLTRDKETFTQIQVESVTDLSSIRRHVLFVGTDAGNLIKFVSIKDENGVIENIQLSEYKLNEGTITGLLLSSSLHQLYVQTETKVLQISTGNCGAYTDSCPFCDPCRMCIASRDPSCVWDSQTAQCIDMRDTSISSHLLQDVVAGDVNICGDVISRDVEMLTPQIGFPVILGQPVTNPSVTVQWFNRTDCDVELTDSAKSTDYDVTADQRLVISSFSIYDASSIFVATYSVKGSKNVGKQTISFLPLPPIISPKTTSTATIKTTKVTETVARSSPFSPSSDKTFNTTLITDGSSITPLPVGMSNVSVIIVVACASVLILVIVLLLMIHKCRHRHKHLISKNMEKPASDGLREENMELMTRQIAPPVSDDDKLESNTPVYACLDSQSSSPTKSDPIEFIDGPDVPRHPPQRSKSVSRKDIQIKIADDEYKFRSIKRHGTRKTIMIEIDVPPDLEFDAEDASHVESGYEKLFGSPSLADVSANLPEARDRGPPIPTRNDSLEKLLSPKPTESDALMKDARLSHLLGSTSRQSTPLHPGPTHNIPNKLLASSYNPRLRSNQSSPLSSPRDQSTSKSLPVSQSRDNKSSTSTNSTQSYQTAPSSPTHNLDHRLFPQLPLGT